VRTLDGDDDFRSCGAEAWHGRAALEQQGAVDSVARRLVDEVVIWDREGMSESAGRQPGPVLAPDQLARIRDLLVAELTALRNRALEQCVGPDEVDEVFRLRAERLRLRAVGVPPTASDSAGTSAPKEEPEHFRLDGGRRAAIS
jgi:hypothetical protein